VWPEMDRQSNFAGEIGVARTSTEELLAQ